MSVYVVSTEKNILNIPKQVEALDVNTRNQYYATILGQDAGINNQGRFNVFVGFTAGNKNKSGRDNVYVGTGAGQNATQNNNILIGTYAGQFLNQGSENILVGTQAGRYSTGNKNILIGHNNTVLNEFNNSSNNIGIGADQVNLGFNNISIGRNNILLSSNSLVFGTNVANNGLNNIIIGNNIENYGSNVLIIKNNHSNVRFVNNESDYVNINDVFFSYKDSNNEVVTTVKGDKTIVQGKISGIVMSDGMEFVGGPSQLSLGEIIKLDGAFSDLILDHTIYLMSDSGSLLISPSNITLTSTSNGSVVNIGSNFTVSTPESFLTMSDVFSWQGSNANIYISSNTVRLASSNASELIFSGSNTSIIMTSNIYIGGPQATNLSMQGRNVLFTLSSSNVVIEASNTNLIALQGSNNKLELSPSHVFLGGPDLNNILLQSRNSRMDMSSSEIHISSGISGLFVSDDLITLSNSKDTLWMDNEGITFGTDKVSLNLSALEIAASNDHNTFSLLPSKIVVGGSTVSSFEFFGNNMGLVVEPDHISLSNENNRLYLGASMTHLGVTGSGTLDMTGSDITLSNNTSYLQLTSWPVFKNNANVGLQLESEWIHMDGNMYGSYAVFHSNVTFMNRARFAYADSNNGHWEIFLDPKSQTSSDLLLKSKNNTIITFTDDFESELLNFTGKHRCNMQECISTRSDTDLTGLIVCSSGRYADLDNNSRIHIDEAIPIVRLATRAFDATVFGVICDIEKEDEMRRYKIGNMQFAKSKKNHKDRKVIVNAHGEGGIWICDANGPLQNGDLITTSRVPGYGMRQKSKGVKSYTVAKITCDCDFSLHSDVYECQHFVYKGEMYKKAFVGCIYKV